MITNYTAKKILDAMCAKSSSATIANSVYLALSTTEPNRAGGNVTEPTASSYKRKCIGVANQSATQYMGAAVGNTITNTEEIHFNMAQEAWATAEVPLKYACLYDAANGGNLIAWGELGETTDSGFTAKPVVPVADSAVVLLAGNIKITLE